MATGENYFAAAGEVAAALRRVATVGVIAAALCWSVPTSAQFLSGGERAQLETQKAQLFRRMMANPANLDVTFAYAEVAARLGDNEAAVAALERMLLFNPNLASVQLELGALYFRMGSFLVARSYFEKALTLNPSPEVKARIDRYLTEIDLQLSPQRLTGIVLLGGEYQSDANVAPGSGLINSPIGPVLLNSQFVKQDSGQIFGTAAGLYTYDLGTQNADKLEVTGVGFVDHYFRFTRLDLDLVEATIGPRFNFPAPYQGIASASLKPYFLANEVALGLSQYFYTYGGGIEATAALPEDIAVKAAFEYRQKNFSNAPERPFSTGLEGNDKLLSLLVKKLLTPTSEVNFEFDYLNQSTRFTFYSNEAYALSGSYRIRYNDPTGILSLPWETAIFGGYVRDDYDSPDPCCNTSTDPAVITLGVRHDDRWRFGVSQTFQLMPNIAVVLQFQRDIVGSNLPLYAYTSNSVLVGPQIRF